MHRMSLARRDLRRHIRLRRLAFVTKFVSHLHQVLVDSAVIMIRVFPCLDTYTRECYPDIGYRIVIGDFNQLTDNDSDLGKRKLKTGNDSGINCG